MVAADSVQIINLIISEQLELPGFFSEENLFKKNLGVLSFGKLRGSYGITGSDQIQDYSFMNLYNLLNFGVPYQNSIGIFPTGLPNPYLQWEETRKLQLGIELGFY